MIPYSRHDEVPAPMIGPLEMAPVAELGTSPATRGPYEAQAVHQGADHLGLEDGEEAENIRAGTHGIPPVISTVEERRVRECRWDGQAVQGTSRCTDCAGGDFLYPKPFDFGACLALATLTSGGGGGGHGYTVSPHAALISMFAARMPERSAPSM